MSQQLKVVKNDMAASFDTYLASGILAGTERPEITVINCITGVQYKTLLDICKTGTDAEIKIALRAYINMLNDLHTRLS